MEKGSGGSGSLGCLYALVPGTTAPLLVLAYATSPDFFFLSFGKDLLRCPGPWLTEFMFAVDAKVAVSRSAIDASGKPGPAGVALGAEGVGDCRRPERENLWMVQVYSAGAGTAGGIPTGCMVGGSQAVTAIDFFLPQSSNNALGRRDTYSIKIQERGYLVSKRQPLTLVWRFDNFRLLSSSLE